MEQNELKQILKDAEKSKILDFKAQNLNEENMRSIADSIPKIEGLMAISFADSVMEPKIPEYLFDAIKNCQNLLYLDMSWCKLKEQDIKSLSAAIVQHPTLLSLNLTECGITSGINDLANILQNNDKLLSINLYGNHLGFTGGEKIVQAVHNNKKLLALTIGHNEIGVEAEEKICERIRENLKSFKTTVVKEGKFNSITIIPSALTEHLDKLTSSFVERPLKLKDNPIVFIGSWQQVEQKRQNALVNTKEGQSGLLSQYQAIQDKIKSGNSIENSGSEKENLPPNLTVT